MPTQHSVTHATFVIERSYPASPTRVFNAFADPAIKARWFGNDEMPTAQHELDFRVGGREINRGGPPDGPLYTFDARFEDILDQQRIVTTYVMYMGETRISVSVGTWEFCPEGRGTRLVYTEQGAYLDGYDNPRQREEGTRELLQSLARELESPDPALSERSLVVMRKVVVLEHLSLDGFLATPDGSLDWVHIDDEIWEFVEPVITACDTAIYGRKTYELMAAYWPTAAESPNASAHDVEHGRWTAKATKLVLSRTLTAAPWGATASATLVREDAAEALRRRKQEPGGDMVLLGSASVARALITAGLVDDYYLTINPVVLGDGIPLFPAGAGPRKLELQDIRRFASGVVGLHYRA